MKQLAIVKGIVVYEAAEGETNLVPTGPCELEDKVSGGARLTWNDAYGNPCHGDLNEMQIAYYLESKALVVDTQPRMI